MPRLLNKPWLEAYMDYVKDTENPITYNYWSGISALSATLKRKVFLWYHGIKFFPNQYIILVGPPGLGKGSSIIPAVSLAKEADTVNYLSDRITAEKIIEKLAQGFQSTPNMQPSGQIVLTPDHTATILAKELPVFLGSSDWMHSLLCQLWDENEFEHQTKNKGSLFIKNMCVGMLGGCVPEYIRKLTKDSMAPITGGFTARCIFVYATKKFQLISDGWGAPNGAKHALHQALVDDLKHIATLNGQMSLDQEARKLWDKKYGEYGIVDEFESDALANFKSRVPSHVIKVALSICISHTDDLVITKSHLQEAVRLVEEVRDNVDITFRAVGESPLAAAQDRVMRFIESRGLCSRDEILKYNHRHITDEQLTQVLRILCSADYAIEVRRGNKIMYEHRLQVVVKMKGAKINVGSGEETDEG